MKSTVTGEYGVPTPYSFNPDEDQKNMTALEEIGVGLASAGAVVNGAADIAPQELVPPRIWPTARS